MMNSYRFDFANLAKLYKVFGRHYRKQWRPLTLAIIGMLGSIATNLLQPWPLKLILDHLILGEPFPDEVSFLTNWFGTNIVVLLVVLAVSVIVITLLKSITSYIHRYYIAAAGHTIVTDVRERVFAHFQRLSLSFHDSTQSGDIIYRLTSDVSDFRLFLVDAPFLVIAKDSFHRFNHRGDDSSRMEIRIDGLRDRPAPVSIYPTH